MVELSGNLLPAEAVDPRWQLSTADGAGLVIQVEEGNASGDGTRHVSRVIVLLHGCHHACQILERIAIAILDLGVKECYVGAAVSRVEKGEGIRICVDIGTRGLHEPQSFEGAEAAERADHAPSLGGAIGA